MGLRAQPTTSSSIGIHLHVFLAEPRYQRHFDFVACVPALPKLGGTGASLPPSALMGAVREASIFCLILSPLVRPTPLVSLFYRGTNWSRTHGQRG